MIHSHEFYIICFCPSRPRKTSVHRTITMLRMSLYLAVITTPSKAAMLDEELVTLSSHDQVFCSKLQSSSLLILDKMINWKYPDSVLLVTGLFSQMRGHCHNQQTRKMRRYQTISRARVLKATSVRKVRTKSEEAYAGSHSRNIGRETTNSIAFLTCLTLRVRLANHHFRRETLKYIFPPCIPKNHSHPFRHESHSF